MESPDEKKYLNAELSDQVTLRVFNKKTSHVRIKMISEITDTYPQYALEKNISPVSDTDFNSWEMFSDGGFSVKDICLLRYENLSWEKLICFSKEEIQNLQLISVKKNTKKPPLIGKVLDTILGGYNLEREYKRQLLGDTLVFKYIIRHEAN